MGLRGVGVVLRSVGDLLSTVCSRETLDCLHQSSVSQVCRRDLADGQRFS